MISLGGTSSGVEVIIPEEAFSASDGEPVSVTITQYDDSIVVFLYIFFYTASILLFSWVFFFYQVFPFFAIFTLPLSKQ